MVSDAYVLFHQIAIGSCCCLLLPSFTFQCAGDFCIIERNAAPTLQLFIHRAGLATVMLLSVRSVDPFGYRDAFPAEVGFCLQHAVSMVTICAALLIARLHLDILYSSQLKHYGKWIKILLTWIASVYCVLMLGVTLPLSLLHRHDPTPRGIIDVSFVVLIVLAISATYSVAYRLSKVVGESLHVQKQQSLDSVAFAIASAQGRERSKKTLRNLYVLLVFYSFWGTLTVAGHAYAFFHRIHSDKYELEYPAEDGLLFAVDCSQDAAAVLLLVGLMWYGHLPLVGDAVNWTIASKGKRAARMAQMAHSRHRSITRSRHQAVEMVPTNPANPNESSTTPLPAGPEQAKSPTSGPLPAGPDGATSPGGTLRLHGSLRKSPMGTWSRPMSMPLTSRSQGGSTLRRQKTQQPTTQLDVQQIWALAMAHTRSRQPSATETPEKVADKSVDLVHALNALEKAKICNVPSLTGKRPSQQVQAPKSVPVQQRPKPSEESSGTPTPTTASPRRINSLDKPLLTVDLNQVSVDMVPQLAAAKSTGPTPAESPSMSRLSSPSGNLPPAGTATTTPPATTDTRDHSVVTVPASLTTSPPQRPDQPPPSKMVIEPPPAADHAQAQSTATTAARPAEVNAPPTPVLRPAEQPPPAPTPTHLKLKPSAAELRVEAKESGVGQHRPGLSLTPHATQKLEISGKLGERSQPSSKAPTPTGSPARHGMKPSLEQLSPIIQARVLALSPPSPHARGGTRADSAELPSKTNTSSGQRVGQLVSLYEGRTSTKTETKSKDSADTPKDSPKLQAQRSSL